MAINGSTDNFDFDDFDKKLQTSLFRIDCPTSLQLGEYRLGLLPPAVNEEIAHHLKSCIHCREESAYLKAFVKTPVKQEEQATTIADDTGNVIPFRTQVPFQETTLLASVRGVDAGLPGSKCIIKLGKNTSLVLFYNIDREGDGYTCTGQFVPDAAQETALSCSQVEIWQEDQIRTTCRVDELYAFSFKLTVLEPVILRVAGLQGILCSARLDLREG